MKLRIINKKRFIFSITIIVGILLFIILGNTVLSHSTEQYSTILVSSGDTLWSIAKEVKHNNPSYEKKDIREIVSHIKYINNLKTGDLTNNQILTIPTI